MGVDVPASGAADGVLVVTPLLQPVPVSLHICSILAGQGKWLCDELVMCSLVDAVANAAGMLYSQR